MALTNSPHFDFWAQERLRFFHSSSLSYTPSSTSNRWLSRISQFFCADPLLCHCGLLIQDLLLEIGEKESKMGILRLICPMPCSKWKSKIRLTETNIRSLIYRYLTWIGNLHIFFVMKKWNLGVTFAYKIFFWIF